MARIRAEQPGDHQAIHDCMVEVFLDGDLQGDSAQF